MNITNHTATRVELEPGDDAYDLYSFLGEITADDQHITIRDGALWLIDSGPID